MPVLGAGGYQVGLEGHDLAPSYAISINDYEIDENIVRSVISVEYDSADNIADMMKLTIANPNFLVSDQKVFQIGNVIKLWVGFEYLTYVGACIIEKVRPYYPSEGMPTIEVVAYSADRLMMRNAPDSSDELKPFMTEKEQQKERDRQRKARNRGYQLFRGKQWLEGTLYSEVVAEKAESYNFDADIDETPKNIVGPAGVIQKVGMTDYQFVAGLANELIWLFWVDMKEEESTWTLHLRDPDTVGDIQEEKFTFRYNSLTDGGGTFSIGASPTTLLEFEGEQLMGEGPTDLRIQLKNPKTGQLESYSVIGDPADDSVEFMGVVDDPVEKHPDNPAQISLSFNNVAVRVIADRQFQTPAQVKEWAEAWYNEHHRDFYSGSGVVRGPGVEKLRAMQVHAMDGLGKAWSGDYYFTNVIHKLDAQNGYSVTWHGRKVTPAAGVDLATATSNL